MTSSTYYPPSYPCGVFLVPSRQRLEPLLSRLRATRRLKSGHKVTVFDGALFAELAEELTVEMPASAVEGHRDGALKNKEEPRCSVSVVTECYLRETLLQLYETTDSEALALEMITHARGRKEVPEGDGAAVHLARCPPGCEPHALGISSLGAAASGERCVLTTAHCSVEGDQFLSLLRVPCAAREDTQWPPYMAVHVVGVFPEAELLEFLSPSGPCGNQSTNIDGAQGRQGMDSSLAVAYIRGVRRFHRVCCPVLGDMPSALAAMRHMALLQRHRCHVQPDEGAPSVAFVSPQCTSGMSASTSHESDSTCNSLFTFSELFGGIGMFRSALERVGGRAAFAVEFAPPAQIVYALNHHCLHDCCAALQLVHADPGHPRPGSDAFVNERSCHRRVRFPEATESSGPFLVGDITEIPSAFFPEHDVLTGGFPCQSFAKAGDAAGLHAEKGWLFYEVVRVLAATQPTAFLLENVEHLVEVEAGAQLAEILAQLRRPTSALSTSTSKSSAHEYEVQYAVVDGGALTPQTRKRVYFFGFRVASALEQTHSTCYDYYFPSRRFVLPRAENGEASAAAARVVADALQQIKSASLHSPYRNVGELLVAPSVVDVLNSTPQEYSVQSASASAAHGVRSGIRSSTHDDLQLTPVQWEAVQRSRTYRKSPLWRLCDLRGHARTLMGSYRTSYQLYSEFVPYSSELTLDEVVTKLQGEAFPAPGANDGGEGPHGFDGSRVTVPSSPPLRFFTLRECARLQGIDDDFRLPHDTMQVQKSIDAGADAIPQKVLRQVPPGAVYKLIGNAVNPRVVACLGGAIASYLQERRV